MPFDSSNLIPFPGRANLSAPPLGFDEARAFSQVPLERRAARANVVLPDLDRRARQSVFAQSGKTPEEEDRATKRMTGIIMAACVLLYIAVGAWLGWQMLDALFDAAQANAAEAQARGRF